MLRKIIKSKTFKVVSVFTAYSMILQIMAPAAWALTSGPTQPEVGGFQQANVSEMVDLFSGDFSYNLPLVTVPGPNGGYPINLTYNSNITMEQEASWVGLGWNVNTGVINRNMRGLPDDYSGDTITRTFFTSPKATLLMDFDFSRVWKRKQTELFAFDITKIGIGPKLFWDSYKGWGAKIAGYTDFKAQLLGFPMTGGLGLDLNSSTGANLNPKLGFTTGEDDKYGYNFGLSVNSRQGLSDIYFQASKNHDGSGKLLGKSVAGNTGAGISYAYASYIPGYEVPMTGESYEGEFKWGAQRGPSSNEHKFKASWGCVQVKDTTLYRKGYGYVYSDHASATDDVLDFNREKNAPVNKHAKALPIPHATHDVFTIKGQGTGGVFRAHRSDIAVFHDPAVESKEQGYSVGLDVDPPEGVTAKVGVGGSYSRTYSYSGTWKKKADQLTDDYGFDTAVVNTKYEPYYLKAAGELTSDNYTSEAPHSEAPINVEIAKFFDGDGISFSPKIRPYVKEKNGNRHALNAADRTDRHTRTQHISFLTRSELDKQTDKEVTDEQGNVIENYSTSMVYNGTHDVSEHIGEFTVVNPDGTVYKYGLPAYNYYQREASFAIEQGRTSSAIRNKLVNYTSGEHDATYNNQGADQFCSRVELAPYAHSFFITELQGPNYADIDDTVGVSDGDVGYWVKFNYQRRYDKDTVYKWRVPYDAGQANLTSGGLSNPLDDRGSYTYGEKEVIYVQSVETKTHIARFYKSTRDDGAGVNNSNGGINSSNKLMKLDSIKLFNKNDNSYAIKTVHFRYKTSAADQLCGNVPNSTQTNGGKLTLSKVWFTYGDNDRGSLSPYEFTYHATDEDYSLLKQDRWGQYQDDDPNNSPFLSNLDNPYVNQKDTLVPDGLGDSEREHAASVWRLTKIALPSGGEIDIEYEMDDYAYVQDKRAMQMCRIVDTGEEGMGAAAGDGNIAPNYKRVYFELEKLIPADADSLNQLKKYLEDLEGERIYFKTYTKLKETPANYGDNPTEIDNDAMAYDYVEGYCKLNIDLDNETGFGFSTDANHKSNGKFKFAYVTVDLEPLRDKDPSPEQIHPFQKAALQYMRLQRPDLFTAPLGQEKFKGKKGFRDAMKDFVMPTMTAGKDLMRLIMGWYKYAVKKNYGSELVVLNEESNFKPSFIRLNSPDYIKYGGGSRVKKITINDGWNTISGLTDAENYKYGQEYTYRLEDGKSSGVAEYEPLVGGEENPFRKPIRYSSDRPLVKDNALYVEEPYNESLFPSANVGYSRIVVKNLERTDDNDETVTKDTQGFQVHEFYTAKDFPVTPSATQVDYEPFFVPIPISFIGSFLYKNDGYSQGYSIELNNMHGKMKSTATYPYGSDPSDVATAKTEYFYKTMKPYDPTGTNRLSSTVDVFVGDGNASQKNLGRTIDFCADLREHTSRSYMLGLDLNAIVSLGAIIGIGVPNASYTKRVFKSVVTNKIVQKTGILETIRVSKEGSVVETQNLNFDPATGQAVLASVQNNFEAPVYSYNFPSHWYYDGMEGAYQTQGFVVNGAAAIQGNCAAGAVLERVSDGKLYWVDQVSPTLLIRDETDTQVALPSGRLKVIRSGRRNQQGIAVGNIESLSNPVSDRYYPLFANPHHSATGFNQKTPFETGFDKDGNNSGFDYVQCNGDTVAINNITFSNIGADLNPDVVHFWYDHGGPGECQISLTFSDGALVAAGAPAVHIDSMNFTWQPDGTIQVSDANATKNGTVSVTGGCEQRVCLDNVLNAFANKMDDTWDLDYADVDAYITDATADANDYRYGQYGIWRMSESYLYKVRRKQKSGTRIGVDGTFKHFTIFDWAGNPNPDWTRHNTVRRYSPYGFELENADAIHTKAAALYSYDNSLVTAVGKNTPYFELAYDGFEDYGGTTYPPSHGHGHLKFTGTGSALSSTEAHTGEYSLKVVQGNDLTYSEASPYFDPVQDKKYHFSCWVKIPDGGGADVVINGKSAVTLSTSNTDEVLDGWRKLEGEFTGKTTGFSIVLKSTVSSTTVYFDDIRVQPFVSTMKSFVYDANTHWLMAELDDRNYATFYNYDEQGHLIQVKKETSKGVVTMRMDRMMVRQP